MTKKKKIKSELPHLRSFLSNRLTKLQFLEYLDGQDACEAAMAYVKSCKNPEQAWNRCDNFLWMDWLMVSIVNGAGNNYLDYVLTIFMDTYPEYGTADLDSPKNAPLLKHMAKELREFVPWPLVQYFILEAI